MSAGGWRQSAVLPIAQRAVHPLLLEALASQQLSSVCSGRQSLPAPPDTQLRDLTTSQVCKALQTVQGNSYVEAVYDGLLLLPPHPLSHSTATSYFAADQTSLSYQGWDAENMSGGSASLATSQPALLAALLDADAPAGHAFPTSGNSGSGLRVTRQKSGQSDSLGSTAAASPKSRPVSLAGSRGDTAKQFYVVHAWEAKFGDLIKLIKQHYEAQVWASLTPSEGQEQSSMTFSLPHKQASWQVKHQLPIYYYVDVLCLNHSNGAVDAWLNQDCQRAMAAADAVVLAVSPSLEKPLLASSFWNLFEVLLAALLQLPIQAVLPQEVVSKVSQTHMNESIKESAARLHMDTAGVCPAVGPRCGKLLDTFDKKVLTGLDLAVTKTASAADRDQVVQFINDWSADIRLPGKSATTKTASQSGAGPHQPAVWATGLDALVDVLRGRLRAAVAEALFWGHMQSTHKLQQVVWSARATAAHLAAQLHTHAPTSADLYHMALQSANRPGVKSLSGTHQVLPSLTSQQSETVAPGEGSSMAVQWKIAEHIDEQVATLLMEARRGSPAVAQVPIRCACKCDACTCRLQAILAVNSGTGSPSVYHTPSTLADTRVMSSRSNSQQHTTVQQVILEPSSNGILGSFFPPYGPINKDAVCWRADQLLRRAADPSVRRKQQAKSKDFIVTPGMAAMLLQRREGEHSMSGSVRHEPSASVPPTFRSNLNAHGAASLRNAERILAPSRSGQLCTVEDTDAPLMLPSLGGTGEQSFKTRNNLLSSLPRLSPAQHKLSSVVVPDQYGFLNKARSEFEADKGERSSRHALLPGALPWDEDLRTSSPGIARKTTGGILMVSVPMLSDHHASTPLPSSRHGHGQAGRLGMPHARASAPSGMRRFEDMVLDGPPTPVMFPPVR